MADQQGIGECLHELALFAGAGGGILGGHLLGWRTVCAVECNAFAASVLVARQNDGCLPPFPIWDDVRTFDGRPWRGRVDVVSGGFPCQDISAAGKRAGLAGARSGLWQEMARIVGEVRPHYVLVENSPHLVLRGIHTILGDLAALGYDARWGVFGAADAKAPHQRNRIWIVAHTPKVCSYVGEDHADHSVGGGPVPEPGDCPRSPDLAYSDRERRDGGSGSLRAGGRESANSPPQLGAWWVDEPTVGRMVDGVAHRVGSLEALGNGQVPAVVRLAWGRLRS